MTNWLTALRATCEKATSGKRAIYYPGDQFKCPHILTETGGILFESTCHGKQKEDAEFIALFSPQMVAAMIDMIEASECLEDIDLSCIDTKGYIPSNWCRVCKTKEKLKQLATEGREDGNI